MSSQPSLFAAPPVALDLPTPRFSRREAELWLETELVRFRRGFGFGASDEPDDGPTEERRPVILIPNGDAPPVRHQADREISRPSRDVAAELANEWLASASARLPAHAAAAEWLRASAHDLNLSRWYWDAADEMAAAERADLRRRQRLARADVLIRGLRRGKRLAHEEALAVWAEHDLEAA